MRVGEYLHTQLQSTLEVIYVTHHKSDDGLIGEDRTLPAREHTAALEAAAMGSRVVRAAPHLNVYGRVEYLDRRARL